MSECLAIAEGRPRVQPVAYQPAAIAENQVQVTISGHSTFIIESHEGIRVATDYAGYSGNIVPDAVTMNRAHRSHYTDTPDPAIKHVLRGWNPDGGPVHHDVVVGDIRIRNVTTDIRGGMVGRMPDGNSIFVFEVGGLCIGHLGHLHHELTSGHVGLIGRLDVVMVPVDGGYTIGAGQHDAGAEGSQSPIVIPMHFFGPTTLARFLTNARSDFEVQHVASPTIMLSQDMLPEKPTVMVLGGY